MPKTWTAVQFDLHKQLAGKAKLERVTLPKTLNIRIDIQLDDAVYKDLSKNPTYLQKMQTKAKGYADAAVVDMLKAVVTADTKAKGFDSKTAVMFTKSLQTTLEKRLELAGDQMAKECEKLFEEYKKGQKELQKFRIKAGVKIGLTAVVVAGGAAGSVMSAGALSPLGIVGVVRGGVTISQEITKLALDADKAAKLINKELALLKKIMLDERGGARNAVGRGFSETALNAASTILGVETPSIKNTSGHVEVHKLKIAEAEKKSKKLSESIYGAMDTQENWAKKFEAAKRNLPAAQVGKIKVQLEKAEKALDVMIQKTIQINEAIERAEFRQKTYEETLAKMKAGVPDWLKWVDKAIALTLDVSVAIVDSNSALTKALNSIIAGEQALTDVLMEKI